MQPSGQPPELEHVVRRAKRIRVVDQGRAEQRLAGPRVDNRQPLAERAADRGGTLVEGRPADREGSARLQARRGRTDSSFFGAPGNTISYVDLSSPANEREPQ